VAAGQEAYLKLDALGWPNGGGENKVLEYYVRLMPQTATHRHRAARIPGRQLRWFRPISWTFAFDSALKMSSLQHSGFGAALPLFAFPTA
jgi:hypothetical protein